MGGTHAEPIKDDCAKCGCTACFKLHMLLEHFALLFMVNCGKSLSFCVLPFGLWSKVTLIYVKKAQ